MILVIRVPAIPVAQPRQRHRIAKSAAGKSFVVNYTPSKAPVNDFKATVRHAAASEYQGPPFTGPLRVDVCCVFPRPAGMFWKTKPMPRVPHAKKPDRDNVDKAVLDSLKGLLFLDDAQACQGNIEKWVASGDEQPHVLIGVSEL